MNNLSAPDGTRAPSPASRRMIQGFWLSVAAWSIFFLGLVGALADAAFGISGAMALICYGLCVLGATLVALAAILRSPTPPSFVQELRDPWEE